MTPPIDHDRRLILLSPHDNVAAAACALPRGTELTLAGRTLTLHDDIPLGHKLAVREIPAGDKVIKHGVPIGSVTRGIRAGEHIHTHNLASDYLPTFTLEPNDADDTTRPPEARE